MADILLSDETRRRNLLVKNWFDRFRIATDNIDAEILQQEAVLAKCTILHENRCYCEDGSVREVCHELSMDELKKFLCDWKICAEARKNKIEQQCLLYTGIKGIDVNKKVLAKLEEKQSELHFQIR